MPGCVLRIHGLFEPGVLLERRPLPGVVRADQGVVLVGVSRAEDSISQQVSEALAFLGAHGEQLRMLAHAPGVADAVLDFGRWPSNAFSCSIRFPPELVRASANVGPALEATIYVSENAHMNVKPVAES